VIDAENWKLHESDVRKRRDDEHGRRGELVRSWVAWPNESVLSYNCGQS
jgi:hypothetical protein